MDVNYHFLARLPWLISRSKVKYSAAQTIVEGIDILDWRCYCSGKIISPQKMEFADHVEKTWRVHFVMGVRLNANDLGGLMWL